MRILLLLTLGLVCMSLTSCYEDPANVTLHDTKGESSYAGSPDTAASRDRQDVLAKRFQMVQTDR